MRTSLFYRAVAVIPTVLLVIGAPTAFGEEETSETAAATETAEAPTIPATKWIR